MSSRVRRTEDLFALKTRNFTLQDVSGTYPAINSVLVVGDSKGTIQETKTLKVTSVAATTLTATGTGQTGGLVTSKGLKLTGGTTLSSSVIPPKTMVAAESNNTFLIDVSSNATSPMRIYFPLQSAITGLRYKFVMKTAAPPVNVIISFANNAFVINGVVVEADLGVVKYTNAANMSFSTSATTGDYIQFEGLSSTFVHVNGVCSVADGVKENSDMIMTISTTTLKTLTLPFTIGTGDTLTIEWGDLSSNTYSPGDLIQHLYALENNSYTITINGKADTFGYGDTQFIGNGLITSVDQWGDLGITSFSGAFNGAVNLVFVPPVLPFGVTNISYMFNGASLFNSDISEWDVSQVTNMSHLFYLATVFNQPLDSWDVSSVTNMSSMFYGTQYFDQPLNSWDVSNVTDMREMFYLASRFNNLIDAWDVGNVIYMNGMFTAAYVFNQPIGSWDVGKVTTMYEMFADARTFNKTLASWDVSRVTTFRSMFYLASSYNQPMIDWDLTVAENLESMFNGATQFNQPLNIWTTQTVTNMRAMFIAATNFNQDLYSWNVGNVTNAEYMFCNSGMSGSPGQFPPFGSGVLGYPGFVC
jgi:surface protein